VTAAFVVYGDGAVLSDDAVIRLCLCVKSGGPQYMHGVRFFYNFAKGFADSLDKRRLIMGRGAHCFTVLIRI